MTDYERFAHGGAHPKPPRISAIIGGVAAAISVGAVIVGAIWGYAGVSYATANIPAIQATQKDYGDRITTLEANDKSREQQYREILHQFDRLNDKIDRLSDSKGNDRVREWQR